MVGFTISIFTILIPFCIIIERQSPMTVQKDPNDKYSEYKVDLHCNETHAEDEWDPKTEGKIADWHNRHQDKLLDKFCDDHPGAPQCKVFDD
jgi:hypothetical protein